MAPIRISASLREKVEINQQLAPSSRRLSSRRASFSPQPSPGRQYPPPRAGSWPFGHIRASPGPTLIGTHRVFTSWVRAQDQGATTLGTRAAFVFLIYFFTLATFAKRIAGIGPRCVFGDSSTAHWRGAGAWGTRSRTAQGIARACKPSS